MAVLITEKVLRSLKRADKDIWDSRERGLVLRCRASGKHSWRFQARRGEWFTIGRLEDFDLVQARREAAKLRGDIARGKDPRAEKRAASASSLGKFITDEYGPWAIANRRRGQETVDRLEAVFADLRVAPLKELNLRRIEQWRTGRLEKGKAASTVNRDVADLRSVLTKAVEWGFLPAHPLAKFKAAKVDKRSVVRFLSAEEELRLRAALKARDEKRRAARASANAWRDERNYTTLPDFDVYTDFVHPFVLLALNTGCRRGELLALKWSDVDLSRATLTVHGANAKSLQTRHVPLNTEAVDLLNDWRAPKDRKGLVFPDADGKQVERPKSSWHALMKTAEIKEFRFHDLRHTFASKLAMAGVDLNVIRELLGHASLAMTIKYAHLQPATKAAAVEQLVAKGRRS